MRLTAHHRLGTHVAAQPGFLKQHGRAICLLCLVFIFLLACGVPASTLITQASANSLSIVIHVANQYATGDRPISLANPYTFGASFWQGGKRVNLSGKLSLVCDGIPIQDSDYALSPPRQFAGGAYHCVYTDEHGESTPLTISVPEVPLAITSPALNSTVLLPGKAAPTSLTPTPGKRQPNMVHKFTITYTVPTLPAGGSAQVLNASAACGVNYACGRVDGDGASATGTYVLSDGDLPYGAGFEAFPSGSQGVIQVSTKLSWPLPAGGFQAASVEFDDTFVVPIIWTRDTTAP